MDGQRRLSTRRWRVLAAVVPFLAAGLAAPSPFASAASLAPSRTGPAAQPAVGSGTPGSPTGALPSVVNPIAKKRYWTLVAGSFPAKAPAWWQSADVTLTPTTATAGLARANVRRWQQTPDGVPTRQIVGTVAGCNPNPLGKEGRDCPIYATAPSREYVMLGTYSYDSGSRVLTLGWNPQSVSKRHVNLIASERWRLDVSRDGALGKAYVQTRGGTDLTRITDGFGYGSAQPFTTRAVTSDLLLAPGEVWLGEAKVMKYGVSGSWIKANMPSARLTAGADPNILTFPEVNADGTEANTSCLANQQYMQGITHMVWAHPANRTVIWESYRRCLVRDGVAPYVDTKYGPAGMHVEMLTQVIDDEGRLVGLIGGEASASGMTLKKGWGSYSLHNLVERPHFARQLGLARATR